MSTGTKHLFRKPIRYVRLSDVKPDVVKALRLDLRKSGLATKNTLIS